MELALLFLNGLVLSGVGLRPKWSVFNWKSANLGTRRPLVSLKQIICGCAVCLISHTLPLSSPDPIQAASVRLKLQDLLVRTGLKERSRLLLGPFSCSTSLEAQWCRHSGSPGPKPGSPKLLLDLKGGLLQVCIPVALIQYSPFQDLSQSASALSRVHALINTSRIWLTLIATQKEQWGHFHNSAVCSS